MAGGFKIPFLADVAKFIKGTDNMADALEDVSDSLEDLGKKDDAVDKVEDALKDAGEEAETLEKKLTGAFESAGDEAKSLEKKVSGAFDSIAKDARDAGKKTEDSVKDGTSKAGEGFEELRGEAAGTAREAAASFASIEDAAGALQEVAANALAGFGPAGMAAGVVAAAGIGLAMSALTENADKVNENKEKMLGLAQVIRDNGGTLREADYISAMDDYGYAIQDTKEWFEIFQKSAVSGFDKIREIADKTSLSTQDLFNAGFGDVHQAKKSLEIVQDELQELRDKKEAVYQTEGSILDKVDSDTLASLEEAERLIQENIQAQEDAARVEQTRQEALKGTVEGLKADAEALEEAADKEADLRQYIDGTAEATRRNAEAKEEAAEEEANLRQYIDGTTEALQANLEKLIEHSDTVRGAESAEMDYMDKVADLSKKLTDNGATLDINSEKGRENRRAVLDQAAAIEELAKDSLDAGGKVQDVTGKFKAQRDALVNQVLPAFNGNKDAAQKYIDKILRIPQGANTKVQLTNQEETRRKIEELTAARTIPVHLNPQGKAVENYIIGMTGSKVYVDVVPRNGRGIT